MRKRFVKGVVIVMALALMGLIVIQVRLVKKAIESAEKEWDAQAYNLLGEVTDQIEDQETMLLLQSVLATSSFGLNRDVDGSIESELKNDDLNVAYSASEGTIKVSTDSLPSTFNVDSAQSTELADAPGASVVFTNGKLTMNAAMTRSLIEKANLKYLLAERTKEIPIDTLIQKALMSQEIELDYEYWLTDKTGELLAGNRLTSEGSEAHMYKVPLFSTGDIKGQNGFLLVDFPGRRRYIYASSSMSFVMSGVFILVIIFIFWLTIHNLLKQKRVSKVKTDFINQMTHEFKTPIATIALAADSLNNNKVNRDPRQIAMYARIIKEESKRMNHHVESVLEIAQLNREEVALSIEKLDMNAIVEEAIETVGLRLGKKKGRIVFEPVDSLPGVSGDKKYMISALVNLLDNAIKYCIKKPIIKIDLKSDEDHLMLCVLDNGIGIDLEYRNKIFEKFYRIPSENSEYISGSGLGLSYVKSVLDLHDAQISVTGEGNAGSMFNISLPLTDG